MPLPQRPPVMGKARLVLRIATRDHKGRWRETDYTVALLEPHPAVASLAWRLMKDGGTFHDVRLSDDGASCSCEDFLFCREGKDRAGCKHVAALRAVGLLPG